jgi:2,4-dienoyl-CoA reductase (NADPH2)
MVSMARPLLADPEFVKKAANHRRDEINTCIACNQACLDHTFKSQLASCLVNPRAGHEMTLVLKPARGNAKRIAVVGAGPAGLATATALAERGHEVHLFEAAMQIGGQFNMARRVPGKEEFSETLRYFTRRIAITGVQLHLGQRIGAAELVARRFDEVVLATGVLPRTPKIPGADGANVLSYVDVLLHGAPVGPRVAIIGAGGIGFDVAEFLVTAPGHSPTMNLHEWLAEWGVTDPARVRGGVVPAQPAPPARQVTLLQRKAGKLGKGLGKTTGWIHRTTLQMKRVEMIGGVNYERITPQGVFVTYGDKRADGQIIECDTVVLCAGQEPLRELLAPLKAAGVKTHLIGGADEAAELDAKRAIDQGTRLAAAL